MLQVKPHTIDQLPTIGSAIADVAQIHMPVRIGLEGGLGAGKTTFVRHFVDSLSAGAGKLVSSPTYALLHRYPTTPEVLHLDLYRVSGDDDLESIGFWECANVGISLIEWPSKAPVILGMLDWKLVFRHVNEERRSIQIEAPSVVEDLLSSVFVGRGIGYER